MPGSVEEIPLGVDGDVGDPVGSADEKKLWQLVREQLVVAEVPYEKGQAVESLSDAANLPAAPLSSASPEDVAATLSPKLAAFLIGWRDGVVNVPKPFPHSEWRQIYLTAISDVSRFVELWATWANLVRANVLQLAPCRSRRALHAYGG